MVKLFIAMLVTTVYAQTASAFAINKADPNATILGEYNSRHKECPILAAQRYRESLMENQYGLRINASAIKPIQLGDPKETAAYR